MQELEIAQKQEPSAYLQSIREFADRVAASHSALDMTVADEPDLGQLYAERAVLDTRIREKQRAVALEKGLPPITGNAACNTRG